MKFDIFNLMGSSIREILPPRIVQPVRKNDRATRPKREPLRLFHITNPAGCSVPPQTATAVPRLHNSASATPIPVAVLWLPNRASVEFRLGP